MAFSSFLAKSRMAMIVSAMCPLPKSGLRETTGPIQLVWLGIQLRISNSQVTGNCVNRNMSGTCLILPGISGAELEYQGLDVLIRAQVGWFGKKRPPAGAERG